MRDRAEKETGEKKDYFINVTAETNEMIKRAKIAEDFGFRYTMIDMVTAGWSGLQTLRDHCQDSKQAIHAHRAMHAAFTRNPRHGLSMLALAKSARLVGVDNIHVGTAVGKLVSPKKEVLEIENEIEGHEIEESFKEKILAQKWYGIKPVFAVSSGGLHPGLVPYVAKMIGNDSVLQLGGGIHGHPGGTRAGAKALRQAIDAAMDGENLDDAAKRSENKELRISLEHFGYTRPI